MYNDLKLELSGAPSDIRYEKLNQFYKRIVDTANHRLLEIERFSEQPKYKDVKQFAYKLAMRDIRGMYGENATRFRKSGLPDDFRVIPKYMNKVLNFLDMPTSTKLGVYEVYDKRAETISDRYGVNVNWQTVANLYKSALYEKVSSKYGSKSAIKAIGVIQANKKKVMKGLKNKKPISLQIDDDKELQKKVNNMLRYYKDDVSKLMKRI